MGGLIALEMSHILSKDPRVTVIGVVMIESVFPGLLISQNIAVDAQDICLQGKMSIYEQSKVAKLIFEATRVAKSYKSAMWTPETLSKGDTALRAAHTNPPAPLVLVKASEPVPSRRGTMVPAMLGWDQLGDRWINSVYTVPGHHFSIFEDQNVSLLLCIYVFKSPMADSNHIKVDYLTAILREACIILEISL